MQIICCSFGHWEGYINVLNSQNAESVLLNVECVQLPQEYVLFSHLFIISTLIYINHGCSQLRIMHFHITCKLMDIETSSQNLYRRVVVCTSGGAEISVFWEVRSLCVEKKIQLVATELLIALTICLTRFGHVYAHHQELEIIYVLLPPMVCIALVAGCRRSGAGHQVMRPEWGM